MITKGTVIAYSIVILIILHKLLREVMVPTLLYLFVAMLFLAGGYYFYYGWVAHSLIYVAGGVVLLIALWKK